MANEEHLKILKQGVESWNEWRKDNPEIKPDLSGADLSGEDLSGASLVEANLSGANLSGADLRGVILSGAILVEANLKGADLSGAHLFMADLSGADLSGAHLRGADLIWAKLFKAVLNKADITYANKSKWIIKDVECSEIIDGSHIIFKDKDELEKRYSSIEHAVNLALKLPLSGSLFFTAKIIEQTLNESGKYNVKVRMLKAISDDSSVIEIVTFDEADKLKSLHEDVKKIEGKLDIVCDELKSSDEQSDDILFLKNKVDLPIPILKNYSGINTKAPGAPLTKYCSQLPPPLQKIIEAIQSAIS